MILRSPRCQNSACIKQELFCTYSNLKRSVTRYLQCNHRSHKTMPSRRQSRLITVFIALVSLLFMQLAVAGYACPGVQQKIAEATAMYEAKMPCAESMAINMDDAQPNLCQAHCQVGSQTADKYEVPAPLNISAVPVSFLLPDIAPVFGGTPLQQPHLKRTTAPPVAIQHCCFRI